MRSIDSNEHANLRTATLCDATGRVLTTFSCAAEVGRITIGRGSEAHVRVNDLSVSTLHAAITWEAPRGAHLICDTGSTNGTFVNGQRIRGDAPLQHGATIRVGRTVLRYCHDDSA
ncbi:MAG TPA: FHA domain-containing protein [Thermomicrobiales bacterium]|nr:FHA domain-containing protein [Thermomicrobiales bacterium]